MAVTQSLARAVSAIALISAARKDAVLVHGSSQTTYAAQTSLEADDSGQPVEHPLVEVFFDEFTGQVYVRNDRPWSA